MSKIEDLSEARRKRADEKGEFVEDFAFIAFCIADMARNLAAYAHVVSEKPGLLTMSKRELADLMARDVKMLVERIREFHHKAAEEEPETGAAS
jgi:hypothetical protein